MVEAGAEDLPEAGVGSGVDHFARTGGAAVVDDGVDAFELGRQRLVVVQNVDVVAVLDGFHDISSPRVEHRRFDRVG